MSPVNTSFFAAGAAQLPLLEGTGASFRLAEVKNGIGEKVQQTMDDVKSVQ